MQVLLSWLASNGRAGNRRRSRRWELDSQAVSTADRCDASVLGHRH